MRSFLIILCAFAMLSSVMGVRDAICYLPPGANGDGTMTCLAYIPAYTYKAGLNKCETFIYGGCGGNANRFMTLEECEEKCKE